MSSPFPSTDRVLPARRKKSSAGVFLLGLMLGMLGVTALWYATTNMEEITEIFAPPIRPYAAYVASLEQSQVSESVMGKAWLEAGIRAFDDSTQILPPHQESGYVSSQENPVISYRIRPRRGQLLSIKMELTSVVDSPQVFIELFEQTPGQAMPRLVAFADSGSYHLEYDVEADEVYHLRIQPELLARFSYRLQVVLGASLAFPVEGKDSRAIRSFWGDPRDGGRRKHKGIDIFAKKGTPVLAAIDGRVGRVKEGGLGGKVVWQRDPSNRYSLYYAHLDTQWVRQGQIVKVGDTLGLVGNTGNARYTPSHLHFGIYQRQIGAVDPFPFVDVPDSIPPRIVASETDMLAWYKIRRASELRVAPSAKANLVQNLLPETPVQLLAATGRWHHVQLPDGSRGFVSHTATVPALTPVENVLLTEEQLLYDQASNGVVKTRLPAGSPISLLAQTATYQYIKTEEGVHGYLLR